MFGYRYRLPLADIKHGVCGVMKFLADCSQAKLDANYAPEHREMIRGQLLTPLTNYALWDDDSEFACDNGAYGGLNLPAFRRMLARAEAHQHRCLFVSVPDIVGNARRTMELWKARFEFTGGEHSGWRLALVAQDGLEDMDIPWNNLDALFIGGTGEDGKSGWKDSQSAQDIVRTAVALQVHTHIGRVNSASRYERFADLGAHTCDGSGVSRGLGKHLARITGGINSGQRELGYVY